MNDEIKEILDDLDYAKNKQRGTITLNQKDIDLLLDYITNLQEQLHQASLDIQELTERDIECPSWCDKLTNLQQENERLKTKTKEQSLLLIDYQDMEQKLEDYKSRIEKAVEYMDNTFNITSVKEMFDIMNKLEDILNGRSDE